MHMRARACGWYPVRGTWYALCMATYQVFNFLNPLMNMNTLSSARIVHAH